MITLSELCSQLLPPHEHLKFKTLILNEQRIILVAAMMAAYSTRKLPPIPRQSCHQFHVKTATDSTRKLPLIPR